MTPGIVKHRRGFGVASGWNDPAAVIPGEETAGGQCMQGDRTIAGLVRSPTVACGDFPRLYTV